MLHRTVRKIPSSMPFVKESLSHAEKCFKDDWKLWISFTQYQAIIFFLIFLCHCNSNAHSPCSIWIYPEQ